MDVLCRHIHWTAQVMSGKYPVQVLTACRTACAIFRRIMALAKMDLEKNSCRWSRLAIWTVGLAVACGTDDQRGSADASVPDSSAGAGTGSGTGGRTVEAGQAGEAGAVEPGGAANAGGAAGDSSAAGSLSVGGSGGTAGAAGSTQEGGAAGAAGNGSEVELNCPEESITQASGLCDPLPEEEGIGSSFEDCVFKVAGIFRYPERVIVTLDCESIPQAEDSTEPAFQVVFDYAGYFHKVVLNEPACQVIETDPEVSVDLYNGQPCE